MTVAGRRRSTLTATSSPLSSSRFKEMHRSTIDPASAPLSTVRGPSVNRRCARSLRYHCNAHQNTAGAGQFPKGRALVNSLAQRKKCLLDSSRVVVFVILVHHTAGILMGRFNCSTILLHRYDLLEIRLVPHQSRICARYRRRRRRRAVPTINISLPCRFKKCRRQCFVLHDGNEMTLRVGIWSNQPFM